MKTKVLVTGDRNWDNFDLIVDVLSQYDPENTIIIEGEAPGADTQCRIVAEELGMEVIKMPAHWRHTSECPKDCKKMVGRPAGVIRNSEMLALNPDEVQAFHENLSESKGTKDMVSKSLKARKLVYIHTGKAHVLLTPVTDLRNLQDRIEFPWP